jgi:hypothetical protein
MLGASLALVLLGASLALAAPKTGIDPKADEILRQACDRLKNARQFRVQAQENFDQVTASGQKIQYSNSRMVAVKRPNRFYTEINGDTSNRKVYYNGDTLTLYESEHNVYCVEKAKSDIDATVDHFFKTYGISVPLADLVMSDPYKDLTENIKTGTYLGIHRVGETKCHHLAFTQDVVDWQVWIDAGDQPVLRKVVITYKQMPGQPQYMATLQNWDLSADLPETTFRFTAPQGASKIDVMPLPATRPGAAANP